MAFEGLWKHAYTQNVVWSEIDDTKLLPVRNKNM